MSSNSLPNAALRLLKSMMACLTNWNHRMIERYKEEQESKNRIQFEQFVVNQVIPELQDEVVKMLGNVRPHELAPLVSADSLICNKFYIINDSLIVILNWDKVASFSNRTQIQYVTNKFNHVITNEYRKIQSGKSSPIGYGLLINSAYQIVRIDDLAYNIAITFRIKL